MTASASPKKPASRPERTPATLTFDQTCTLGARAVVAAVGDLLFHDALQAQALRPGVDFRRFWARVAPVLAGADMTYGNLESPIAAGVAPGGVATKDPGRVHDRRIYGKASSALIFNTHPSVAVDLKASGFTVVSTANNHAADRGSLGIDRTLEALAGVGIAATGTRPRSPEAAHRWSVRTSANGLTVAWLACTYGLNGMPDRHGQVLQCYVDKEAVMAELRAMAADPDVDAVILTPHWGSEGASRPSAADRAYARDAVNAGATAIIGAHPHVLQPWEKLSTDDGREALVIYSTGNFISNQGSDAQRTGLIALIELTKSAGAARARISAAGYVPTFVEMANDRGHSVVELTRDHRAAAAVKTLLPDGNRVTAARFRDLPRACNPEPVVSVSVAAVASAPDSPGLTRVALVDTTRPDVPPAAVASAPPAERAHTVPPPEPDPPVPAITPTMRYPVVVMAPAPSLPLRDPAPPRNDPVRWARLRPGFPAVGRLQVPPMRVVVEDHHLRA